MSETHESLRETNARLQARVDELEARLAHETTQPIVTTDTAERARALPGTRGA